MKRYGYSAILGRRSPKASREATPDSPRDLALASGLLTLAVTVALTATLAACAPRVATPRAAPHSGTTQFIDEAFAALFPATAARLGALPEAAPQRLVPAPKRAMPAAPIALQGIDQAVNRLLASLPQAGATSAGMPAETATAIIASPLAAERLIAAASRAGATPPPLVVPFAAGFGISGGGVREVGYDYARAYAMMGRRAASALGEFPSEGDKFPTCGIVFQKNFMRGDDALAAFSAAFSAASGREPIVVALEERAAVDPTGTAKAAIAELLGDSAAEPGNAGRPFIKVLVLSIDNAAIAEDAAAKARGIAVLVDASSWGEREPAGRLYRATIRGNEAGLVRAAEDVARRLAAGRDAPAFTAVPLRLSPSFPRIFYKR